MVDCERLCIELLHSESEEEVVSTLKKTGLWDDSQFWRNYGNLENNFSIIGNQQSSPDAALVEKLVNAIDAILMAKCLQNNIDPEGEVTPPSMGQAVEEFFGVPGGILYRISTSQRRKIAENVSLVATGSKERPNYLIIDKGEGQEPQKFEQTFLSLAGSNKIRRSLLAIPDIKW